MANTTIKITQLQNIGNGLAGNTLLPVVNTTGTAITQKVTVGNVANFVLGQAGNTLAPAFLSTLAYSVANAAQPNITSVGTLNVNTLRISGGTNGYFLQTNGNGNLAWTAPGGSGNGEVGGANTQIQFNDAGNFGGNAGLTFNKTTGVLTAPFADVSGVANIVGGGATVATKSVLNVASTFGSNSSAEPASAQAVRGRVTGSNLTKTRNYVTGVTGQYLITGTNASEFINTGLLGVVGDQTTTANAAVVAYLDGDGGLTTAGSAYGVSMKNSTPGSGFDYGLDLQFINLNVAGTTTPFKQADIRFNNGVELVANTANNISINANVTAGNVLTSANVIANGAIESGTGFTTGGYLSVDGNTDLHNTVVTGNLSATGNITANNIGNIATINLTGSNSNVLYGNGVFAAVPAPTVAQDITSNGAMSIMLFDGNIKYNNYATVEPSSGNIAGGNISANGNISGGNISTTGNITANNLGNISSINIDGSNTNVLYGNGVFAAVAGGNANTGNVTFDDNIVIGTGDEFGGDGLFLAPGNGSIANSAVQYLRVRGGDAPTHIHLDTGNNQFYDQYFGDDAKYVKLELGDAGNVVVGTDDANGNSYNWTFTSDGNLILADGNSIIQSIANSSLDPLNPNVSTMVLTPDPGYSSQALVLDPTAPGHIHLRSPGANIDEPSANLFLGGETSSFEIGYYNGAAPNLFIHSGNNTWTFDNTGALTLPQGSQISETANTSVNITANANTWAFGVDGNLTVPGSIINDTSIVLSAPAVFNICTIATAGSGYNTGSSLKATTGGSGTGMTVGIGYGLSNQLTSVSVVNPGTGYVNGDVITVSEGTGGTFVITKYNVLANQTNNNTVQTDLIFANNTVTLPIYGEMATDANMTLTTNLANAGNTSSWTFGTTGNLTLPTGGHIIVSGGIVGSGASPAPYISGFDSISALEFTNGTSNVTVTANASSWTFGTNGNLILPQGGIVTNNIPSVTFDILYQYDDLVWSGNTLTFTNASSTYMLAVLALMEVGDAITLGGTSTTVTGVYTGGGAGTFTVSGTGAGQQIAQFTLPNRLTSVNGIKLTTNAKNYLFTEAGVTQSPVLTVDTLPSGQYAVAGFRAFVSDANLAPVGNFGAIVGNSGSNTVCVWCDGTNWRIG